MACGYSTSAEEVSYYRNFIQIVQAQCPKLLFVVREYPRVPDVEVYENLYFNDNVISDKKIAELADCDSDSDAFKISLMINSTCVIHLGTTMALEAAYLNVPVFTVAVFMDYERHTNHYSLYLENVVRNDHIQEYFFEGDYPNQIRSHADVANFIRFVKGSSINIKDYGRNLVKLLGC